MNRISPAPSASSAATPWWQPRLPMANRLDTIAEVPPLPGARDIVNDRLLQAARAELRHVTVTGHALNAGASEAGAASVAEGAKVTAAAGSSAVPASSPATAVAAGLSASSSSSRAETLAAVYLLTWEDFVVDEKGFVFELAHNVVATVAKRHAREAPEWTSAWRDFLRRRDDADEMVGGSSGSAVRAPHAVGAAALAAPPPLLASSKNAFRAHLLQHLEITLSVLMFDFVSLTLNDVAKAERNRIRRLLCVEFGRQRQQRLRGEAAGDRGLGMAVPYPDLRIQLLPNVVPFLYALKQRPDVRLVLMSDKGQCQLENEAARFGFRRYFSIISGCALATVPKAFPDRPIPPLGLPEAITAALRVGSPCHIAKVLGEAAIFSHPDVTQIERRHRDDDRHRLRAVLSNFPVSRATPIIAFGPHVSDALRLTSLASLHTRLRGVVVRPTLSRTDRTILLHDTAENHVAGFHSTALPSRVEGLIALFRLLEGDAIPR